MLEEGCIFLYKRVSSPVASPPVVSSSVVSEQNPVRDQPNSPAHACVQPPQMQPPVDPQQTLDPMEQHHPPCAPDTVPPSDPLDPLASPTVCPTPSPLITIEPSATTHVSCAPEDSTDALGPSGEMGQAPTTLCAGSEEEIEGAVEDHTTTNTASSQHPDLLPSSVQQPGSALPSNTHEHHVTAPMDEALLPPPAPTGDGATDTTDTSSQAVYSCPKCHSTVTKQGTPFTQAGVAIHLSKCRRRTPRLGLSVQHPALAQTLDHDLPLTCISQEPVTILSTSSSQHRFVCHICGSTTNSSCVPFKSEWALKMHVLSHTRDDVVSVDEASSDSEQPPRKAPRHSVRNA